MINYKILAIACFLAFGATFLEPGGQIICYFLIQFALLACLLRRKLMTSLGAFLVLNLLIYGIRPLYIYFENDFRLVAEMTRSPEMLIMISRTMFYATLGTCILGFGYILGNVFFPIKKIIHADNLRRGERSPQPPANAIFPLLILQVVTVLYMFVIGGSGMSLYASAGGAYTYLFPQALQAAQIFIVSFFAVNWNGKNASWKLYAAISTLLFLVYTYLMKEISMFRGFYITGLVGAGIAVYYGRFRRAPYWILVVPVVLFLPVFRILGEYRYASAEDALGSIIAVLSSLTPSNWWEFFNSAGDMNVFDTFVGATESTPESSPYLFAWIYPLLHWIPRAFWPGKPPNGMLVDMAFTEGKPFHPGLMGFYYLDGGFIWMMASCLVTGIVLYLLDRWVLSMRHGYLKSAIYGVIIINSMYFSRGYLHFQVMQYIYMITPILMLSYFLRLVGVADGRELERRKG